MGIGYLNTIIDHYNVQHHPDVTRGNRSENEVYREFNNAFDSYLAYKVDSLRMHHLFEIEN